MSDGRPHRQSTDQLLEAVAAGVGVLVGVDLVRLLRFDADGTVTAVSTWSASGERWMPAGPWPLQDDRVAARVAATGLPARDDGRGGVGGPPAPMPDDLVVRSSVGGPILVEGSLWGTLCVHSTAAHLPAGTEGRLAGIAPLVETAVTDARARGELHARAEEQASVRRIAELVARGVAQGELFAAVADEASKLVEDEPTTLLRFDDDGCATVLATCRGAAPVGARVAVGRGAGAPIVVDGRVWGMLGATTPGRRLPPGAERRLEQFAGLAAAALASAQARTEAQRLAGEQAALRRVAELVARGAPPDQVLGAVVLEASDLLDGVGVSLLRFRPDGDAVVVATHREAAPVGLVVPTQGAPWAADLLRTRRALRVPSFEGTPAEGIARDDEVAAAVVVPILVEGQVWGMLSATMPAGRFPPGFEERLARFASLAGTAVANADSRAQLTASRARVVAAADATRRQLQRDVHDGAQQRLVQTIINLKLARKALASHPWPAAHLIEEGLLHAERASAELRDLVRGILPAPLRGGLRAGVESLCVDLPLAVELQITPERLPVATETTAYFVIAEALANVVKHASARSARVTAAVEGDRLRLEIRDDGVGGADPGRGSGLTGLFDRVEAKEGEVVLDSPPGRGTSLRAAFPVGGA